MSHLVISGIALLGLLACSPEAGSQGESLTPPSSGFSQRGQMIRPPPWLPPSSGTVISPELALPTEHLPSSKEQSSPVVVAGNGLYLVLWVESIVHTYPGESRIYAMRVRASDGAMLDSAPILVAGGVGDQVGPSAAFDGANFLVVWQHVEGVPVNLAEVYATRVRAADGAVLDAPHKINDPPPQVPQYDWLGSWSPQVAFDGTYYLVTYGGYVQDGGGLYNGTLGVWIRPSDGQRAEPTAFVITYPAMGSPRLAYGGGRYLLVWVDNTFSDTSGIYGVRVDAVSRQVLDATPLVIAATEEWEDYPTVASNGSDFLVTWYISGNHSVPVVRVRGSDGALLGPATAVPEVTLAPASVTFDGQDYRMAWLGLVGGGLKVMSTRIPSTGGTWEHHVVSELESISDWDWLGIAAAGRGRLLQAYSRFDPWVNHAKMRLVEDVQPEDL